MRENPFGQGYRAWGADRPWVGGGLGPRRRGGGAGLGDLGPQMRGGAAAKKSAVEPLAHHPDLQSAVPQIEFPQGSAPSPSCPAPGIRPKAHPATSRRIYRDLGEGGPVLVNRRREDDLLDPWPGFRPGATEEAGASRSPLPRARPAPPEPEGWPVKSHSASERTFPPGATKEGRQHHPRHPRIWPVTAIRTVRSPPGRGALAPGERTVMSWAPVLSLCGRSRQRLAYFRVPGSDEPGKHRPPLLEYRGPVKGDGEFRALPVDPRRILASGRGRESGEPHVQLVPLDQDCADNVGVDAFGRGPIREVVFASDTFPRYFATVITGWKDADEPRRLETPRL